MAHKCSRGDVRILEWGTADQMIDTFTPVLIHIFFGVVEVDPASILLDDLFGMLLRSLEISVVKFLAVSESLPLST